MQAADQPRFREVVTALFARYPSAAMSSATLPAWWAELEQYPLAAIEEAVKQAPRGKPDFVPSCEAVREIAEVEATRLAHVKAKADASRMFPLPVRSESQQRTLESFYSSCDRAKNAVGEDGKSWRPDDEHTVLNLVAMMLRSYGSRDDASIDQFAGWVLSDCKFNEMSPRACVYGLRQVPAVCIKAPSLGMIKTLIRGESMAGFPANLVRTEGAAAPYEPEPKIHPDWATIAAYWEQENKHLEKHPEERPPDLNAQRWSQFWKLWDRVVEGKVMT